MTIIFLESIPGTGKSTATSKLSNLGFCIIDPNIYPHPLASHQLMLQDFMNNKSLPEEPEDIYKGIEAQAINTTLELLIHPSEISTSERKKNKLRTSTTMQFKHLII